MTAVEKRIREWRSAVLRGRAVTEADADELEGHLREQLAELEAAGLTEDEAFLIAVRRLGALDALAAEYAREHGDRLWKQFTLPERDERPRSGLAAMLVFAAIAAVLLEASWQLGRASAEAGDVEGVGRFLRTASLLVLPVLAAYFASTRRMPWARSGVLAGVVAVLALVVGLFPFATGSSTGMLVALHLPFVLWLLVGAAYVGGRVRSSAARMDFIRFTGEWAIYYTMIALGGMVLMGLTSLVLGQVVPAVAGEVWQWMLTMGAAGAVVVAAWLVEAKKSVIENIAPVLTAIFTPLFAAMLLVSAVVYAVGGLGRDFDRELLAGFDVLLLVVLALVLYGISVPDRGRWARTMHGIRLAAVAAAILLDVLVLGSMLARVGELGLTPNRVAALGLNVVLLVNLVVSAVLLVRIVAGRAPVARLERWQTGYLTVFAAWLVVVVLVLPPAFGFA